MERQKYRIRTNASQKEGFRKHRSFPVKILMAIAVLSVAMALSCPDSFALDPPPDWLHDALWWGTWATARLNQKIINYGDVVTLKLDIVGGPGHGFFCRTGAWAMHGTGHVILQNPNPSCFEIIDYNPKGDALHQVNATSSVVDWTALADPAPSTNYDPQTCFCRYDGIGTSSNTIGCGSDFWNHGAYGPGDSFTLTLKATCSGSDTGWRWGDYAELSGDWGLVWSYTAQDYYKLGGSMSVILTADPTTLPADGSLSTLSATVVETQSGVNLSRQPVVFSQMIPIGFINPETSVTDASGVAQSSIGSVRSGTATVTASVPGAQDYILVTFTPTANTLINKNNKLGKGDSESIVVDPVHAGLGNYIYSKPLFSFPGKGLPFNLEANYNALDNTYNGPLGYGWTHTFNVVLTLPIPPSNDVTLKWGDGHEDTFRDDGSGNFTPFNCNTAVTLTKPDPDHYLATLYNKNTYQFDSTGRLLAIADLNGNQITLTHSTQLDRITDTAGRHIDLTYTGGRITAITSPLKSGNTVSFQYDVNGNLTGIVDPRGKTWGFTYDGSHRILTQRDAKGVTVLTNTYDGSGRVAQQQDGAGHLTTFEYTVDATGTRTKVTPPSGNFVWHYYDPAYNLTKVIDGEGNQANFASDSRGRLAGAIGKDNTVRQVVYDANDNPTLARDGTGAMTQFGFNTQNRPTSVTDPLNHSASFGYDANGNLTDVWNANGNHLTVTVDPNGLPVAISDFLGRKWNTSYDGNGLPQTVTDPVGGTTGYTYDPAGRPTQLQLPLPGVAVQTTYDEAGNMLSQTDPLGNITTFSYDDNRNLISRTFVPNGAVTTYAYDWAGRPTAITNTLGGVTTYTYDVDGNLLTSTDPDGVTMTRQYDKSNRLTALVDSLGHHIYYGYDAAGYLTSVRNELGNTWTTTFDAEGRPTQSTDPLGNTNIRAFDAAGRLVSLTDPLNNTQTLWYDAAGRLESTTLPDGGVINYSNDANGRPMGITDPLDHSWSFSYDVAGRLAAKTDPNGKVENYAYDALGRLITKTLRDGQAIAYGYDANSRLTGVTLPGPVTINYTYDAAGNLTTVTDPSGTTTMAYDLLGRRLSRTDPNGKIVAFTYTPAGRLRTLTYPGGNAVTYTYDTTGRLADIADWRSNQTTFQYDALNRVTQVNLPNGTQTLYTYDTAGRVATRVNQKADATVIASYAYSYTPAGQIATVQGSQPLTGSPTPSVSSYSFDPINRMLSANVNGALTTYTFDDRGNLISKELGGTTTTYTYDALNRLVSVADGTNTTTYSYDGSGNRLTKTYNGTTTRYVREGGVVYCTLDGVGTVQAYNVHAGTLLYSLDGSGAVKVYHGDERGSIVAITDASQTVVKSYGYDPYGKVLGASGILVNAFQYIGAHGVLTDENGLYQMQARYYDPEVRRFVTEDPLGLSAGLNLYGYVGGDPVNAIDPAGLQEVRTLNNWVDYPVFDSREEMMDWVESLKQKNANEIAAKEAQWAAKREAYEAWLKTPEGQLEQLANGIKNNRGKTKVGNYTVSTNTWDLKVNIKASAETVEAQGLKYTEDIVGNYQGLGKRILGGGKRLVTKVVENPLSKKIVGYTVKTIESPVGRGVVKYGGKALGALNVVGDIYMAAESGWETGRWIENQSLVYDPGTGKWISVEQAQYDTLWAPYYTRPYADSLTTYDPNLQARKAIRDWCKEHGINYNDALTGKP